MIDKRIYYCWFGKGEMSELNKKCIESWKRKCPDYEIIEINEDNYDVNMTPYSKEAYEHGNWSYVSNAARLYYLINFGGFYLDTDVQLVESLDSLRNFDKGFITEFDSSQPDSGVLGCGSEGCEFYKKAYEKLVPGTVLHKNFIQIMYKDYDVYGEPITTYKDGFTVLGEEFFPSIRTGLMTINTIGIHYFENTWTKSWKEITDDFYPFPRANITFLGKTEHQDENPEINIQIKSLKKQWYNIISRTCYFFNPKVVKLIDRDFVAERIDYDKNAKTKLTITPTGLVVMYIEEES